MDSPEQADLKALFSSCYRHITSSPAPVCSIEYYPYVGLRHTVRSRNGQWAVRLSDLIQDAPDDVTRSVLSLLICKLLQLPAPPGAKNRYLSYVRTPSVKARIRRCRQLRGKKRLTSPRGAVFDLKELFDHLNQAYFSGQLKISHLSWSPTASRSRLGHFDPAHRAIVINRLLDDPCVPRHVVAFVLYHEMLHAKFDRLGSGGGHHREFRRAERRYPYYQRAQQFIAASF